MYVRRIFAFVAANDGIFAGFSQHLEFVGSAPANGARVRFHGAKLQTAAGEDSFIGLEHVLVFTSAVLHINVKAIGILHDELTTPHQTKPRPNFIAKFCLNLVQIEGHLAIGTHDSTHQVGDHFLVCRTQAKVPLVTVFEPDEFLAVNLPATALLPQFCGTGDGKKELLRSRSIHLFANDGFDLSNDLQ